LKALAGSKNNTLTKLALKDVDNKWMQIAILSSLGRGAEKVLTALTDNAEFTAKPNGMLFLQQLCSQMGVRNRPHEVSAVLDVINQHEKLSTPLIESLVSKAQGSQREQLLALTSGKANEILMTLIDNALNAAGDTKLDTTTRIRAIESLQLAKYDRTSSLLDSLLNVNESFEIMAAAIDTLGEYSNPDVAKTLIQRWPTMGPTLRMRAAEALLSRNNWTSSLLDAIEDGQIGRGELDPARIALLKVHPNEVIAARVSKLFTSASNQARQMVIKNYQSALELTGDPGNGKVLFKKHCSACHRLENVGNQIGADLNGIRNRGLDAVLLNILDPNREVKPKYLTYVLVDLDGRSVTGMISDESANSITIRKPDGTSSTLLRSEIDLLKSTGLSFMPEGLEKQINKQQMADLLTYLNSLQ